MKIEKKILSCLLYLGLNLGSVTLSLPGIPLYGLNYPVGKDRVVIAYATSSQCRDVGHLDWNAIYAT